MVIHYCRRKTNDGTALYEQTSVQNRCMVHVWYRAGSGRRKMHGRLVPLSWCAGCKTAKNKRGNSTVDLRLHALTSAPLQPLDHGIFYICPAFLHSPRFCVNSPRVITLKRFKRGTCGRRRGRKEDDEEVGSSPTDVYKV